MERLIIKNIGPIKNIDITLNKINVFIGAQSSGKSTISKILCHCQWVEKTCYLNDSELNKYIKEGKFYDSLIEYHRLEGYFNKTASIKYIGMYLIINYTHSSTKITIKKNRHTIYNYSKISYIPSERNLVAAISNFSKYNETNDVITYFGYDWMDAKEAIRKLDISKILEQNPKRNISYEYKNGKDYIKDGDAEISLRAASSGILSLLPLYLTVSYMCDKVYKMDRPISAEKRKIIIKLSENLLQIKDELKNSADTDIKRLIYNTNRLHADTESFDFIAQNEKKINDVLYFDSLLFFYDQLIEKSNNVFDYIYSQLFIEEPEQNLFPEAQKQLVYNILRKINTRKINKREIDPAKELVRAILFRENIYNTDDDNRLCITTHSPYILYAINNCILGGLVKDKMSVDEFNEIAIKDSFIDPKKISVFQIADGKINNIQNEDGLIGENFFDNIMKELMDDYYELLEYYGEDE